MISEREMGPPEDAERARLAIIRMVELLRDSLALLNDRPRFHTRAGDLDSYKVAGAINAFLQARRIEDLSRKAVEDWYAKAPTCPGS